MTFQQFQGYWPHQGDNPHAVEREIHGHFERMAKVVVSDTLTDTAPWESTTEVVGRAEAADHLRALKQRGSVVVFGSATLRGALFDAGLVDEFHVVVGAAAVGGGTPAFRPMAFRLLGVRTWDEFPSVVLRYAPA
ncbi:dihydrofolate reductase family protein [Actinokineospora soli]|uniref:Dihydrofolate reductase family protein n=1 Tax=Actinokineospora soli TaxID=1048753 RepID=A0ABW2TVY7_9PSEU